MKHIHCQTAHNEQIETGLNKSIYTSDQIENDNKNVDRTKIVRIESWWKYYHKLFFCFVFFSSVFNLILIRRPRSLLLSLSTLLNIYTQTHTNDGNTWWKCKSNREVVCHLLFTLFFFVLLPQPSSSVSFSILFFFFGEACVLKRVLRSLRFCAGIHETELSCEHFNIYEYSPETIPATSTATLAK